VKFLTTSDTISEIRNLLNGGGVVRVAVSYWGDGAVDSLGITRNQDLTIVCDVLSGGCNPAEIRKLLGVLGDKRVLTYDRLHAKVWLAAGSAIVGSSNASSNGLGFEGEEAASLVEANLVVDDRNALAAMKKWWTEGILTGARAITESDLRRARKLRERHRAIRPLSRDRDLLTGLRTEPQSYRDRNLYVWVWEHEELDDVAQKALEEAKDNLGDDILCWQDVDEPPPPGSVVIEFNSEFSPPAFTGIYRILVDQPVYKTDQCTLLLCRQVHAFEGMSLGHRATWRAAAQRHWKRTTGTLGRRMTSPVSSHHCAPEPRRVFRRLFGLSHAAMAHSSAWA
jgi:hypothetical protein